MSVSKTLQKNLAATWLSHLVMIIVGMFLMPYTLNVLGDTRYGLWIFINSIACYSALLYMGLAEMVARFVATHHAKEEWQPLNEVVTAVFYVYLGFATVTLLVGGGLAWAAPRLHDWAGVPILEIRLVILLLAVIIATGLVSCVFGGVLMGMQRFDLVRTYGTASIIAKLALTVIFLEREWGLLTLAWIYLAVTLIENIGPVFVAYRRLPTLSIHPRNWNQGRLRECFSFSSFKFLEAIAHELIYTTDSVVIGLILGPEAIVPYYVAFRFTEFISKPVSQIGHISMPQAGALHARGDARGLAALLSRSVGWSFVLTSGFFIGAMFFGPAVIKAWVGPGYEDSYHLLLILLGGQLVAIPVVAVRSLLFGAGYYKFPAVVYVTEAFINFGLSLVLIQYWGVTGVAVGTLVPVILLEGFVILPYAFRRLPITPGEMFQRAVQPYILPLLALTGYSLLVSRAFPQADGWLHVGLISAGGGAVLLGMWYLATRVSRPVSPLPVNAEAP